MTGAGITFVLGGARSGKSTYVVDRAERAGGEVLFCATARPDDEEMRERIERHRSRRPPSWTVVEAPKRVGAALRDGIAAHDVVIVDCLTLLVANVLLDLPEEAGSRRAAAAVDEEIGSVLAALEACGARALVVSNEVGQGIVPADPLSRGYRDLLGRVNQRVAAAADEVVWMVAGLAVPVKGPGAVSTGGGAAAAGGRDEG